MDEFRHFVVTITRLSGAKGHDIGKQLSLRLGVRFYDKELLEKAAQRTGYETEFISGHDESVQHRFLAPFLGMDNGDFTLEDKLYRHEMQVIRDLYEKESCVLVGRLSDYILRNEKDVINVYIFGPEDYRVENIIEQNKISRTQARKLVREKDATRENYYKFYTMNHWNQKKGKDILLDSESFGIDGCVDILEAAVRSRFLIRPDEENKQEDKQV